MNKKQRINMHNLQDKIILVSKRMIDNDGNESFDTYFGKVITFSENTVIVLRPNNKEESLPYGEKLLKYGPMGICFGSK